MRLKRFCALRAPAKVQRRPIVLQFDSRLNRLFAQTHGTHRRSAYFPQILFRIVDKHLKASFTAEAVLLPVMLVGDGLVLADSQPDKGAAARGTNWSIHRLSLYTHCRIYYGESLSFASQGKTLEFRELTFSPAELPV
jgi:hypothetical protein